MCVCVCVCVCVRTQVRACLQQSKINVQGRLKYTDGSGGKTLLTYVVNTNHEHNVFLQESRMTDGNDIFTDVKDQTQGQ